MPSPQARQASPPRKIALRELEDLIVEAWLVRAPKQLARDYLERSRKGTAS